MRGNNLAKDFEYGCFFGIPGTEANENGPMTNFALRDAVAYAKKVMKEEGRITTLDEMKQFVIK